MERLEPVESAYAQMHPGDPSESETNNHVRTLYRELECIEAKMASMTARSVDGLMEQMHVLKTHISIEAPELEPLAEAVLRGLRRLKGRVTANL